MAKQSHTPPPRAWTVEMEPAGTETEREDAVRLIRRLVAEWTARRTRPPEA